MMKHSKGFEMGHKQNYGLQNDSFSVGSEMVYSNRVYIGDIIEDLDEFIEKNFKNN